MQTTTYHPEKTGGFTLIEILAAIAILLMLVTVLGVIFTETNRSWALGTGRAQNNSAGRAALSMIAQDLQYAVADDTLTFFTGREREEEAKMIYNAENDELSFVSLQHDSHDGKRTAREVFYFVRKRENEQIYDLMRYYYGGALSGSEAMKHAYQNPDWFNTDDIDPREIKSGNNVPSAICENIACFAIFLPDVSTKTSGGGRGQPVTTTTEYTVKRVPTSGYDSRQNDDELPEYLDLYLEVLDPRAAAQVADMKRHATTPDKGWDAFIEKNVRRYTKRVFFRNRDGYRAGR